ncbi:MAG TPA: hypothetical protein VLX60_15495 [Terriglobales bacterium]|nr:hypothetical protein [Terriglobales bacterium]
MRANRRNPIAFKAISLLTGSLLSVLFFSPFAFAQAPSPDQIKSLSWRLIGPYRGGRVTAVSGIAGDPKTYYMGTPGGGVWKTVNGGVTWFPIFDDAHVASIGDLVVAPSNPNVIYVATGEQTPGNGIWKSTDAGATWTNIGIRDSVTLPSILVDPKDANIVYVAAVGDVTPSDARGIMKTTDGGKSWRKVYFKDNLHSPTELCFDPNDSRIIYAVIRRIPKPRDSDEPEAKAPEEVDSVIIKSTNAGETWSPTGQTGLPSEHRGRIGLAVAAGLSGKRLFALMHQGLFRSDDAGATWQQITADPRVIGDEYFGRTFADPNNPDGVYVLHTSTYRSSDGGRTFTAWKGTPSGEDDHVLWIAPEDSNRILMGTDQGAVITLDGGKIWNTWYNQPTGQFYRVATDRSFPYRLYASQQDSGSVSVPARTDFGLITYRDWIPTGSFESAFIAPDPLDANSVYSIGWYGVILRMTRATGQVATIFQPPANYHITWETPLVFSPRDPRALYYGAQFVVKTTDGGVTWKAISGDLTTNTPAPAAPANPKGNGHVLTKDSNEYSFWPDSDDDEDAPKVPPGALQTIAPSPLDDNLLWAGSTTGLIHVTHDAATWTDVTPIGLPEHPYINCIEASPHDASTAYAAVFPARGPFNLIFSRRDSSPYFYRTRDGGKSWQKITAGLPEVGLARTIREDPVRKGLLFAGTTTGLFVSFDDGDHWQSLQLNLPTATVTDLVIHGSDLVASTFGRGLWILDDISALRQWSAQIAESSAQLLAPEPAFRVRWDNYPDTPLQLETPAALNPPDGAILQYFQKSPAKSALSLDIYDSTGALVRHISSVPAPEESIPPANVPKYWFYPPTALPNQPGVNRFVWDLRYAHPTALPYGYFGARLKYTEYTLPDHAVPGHTPRFQPPGPLIAPGAYDLVFTREGKSYKQKLEVLPDPRVHISTADYSAQLALSRKLCALMEDTARTFNAVTALHAEFDARQKSLPANPPKELADALADFEKQLTALEDGADEAPGFGVLNRDFGHELVMVQSADIKPGESAYRAFTDGCAANAKDLAAWNKLNAETLPALNKLLSAQKAQPLPAAAPSTAPACTP